MKIIVALWNTTASRMIIRSFKGVNMVDLLEENYTPRTVQIWLEDSFMEIELFQPDEWNEDKFYRAAVDYVLSNISIDVL